MLCVRNIAVVALLCPVVSVAIPVRFSPHDFKDLVTISSQNGTSRQGTHIS